MSRASAPEVCRPDVLVVGAGPAGLAAAVAALDAGAAVLLLDAAEDLGGQYWRHPPDSGLDRHGGQHQRATFAALSARVHTDPACEVALGTQVWACDRRHGGPPRVHVVTGPADGDQRHARIIEARAVVLATGAHDRTLPFPGWDLPGVVTAGAAQTLAKAERIAIGQQVLVAGAGPFLLPVAASLLRVGARVLGVLEAAGARQLRQGWAARPWELLSTGAKAGELAGYVRELLVHRVPYRVGTAVIAAHGHDRVEEVTVAALDERWAVRPGSHRRIRVDAVCVGHGFVPRTELATAAGCRVGADAAVLVDDQQATTVPGVYAAGEITGIGGADLAMLTGSIAGRAAAGGRADPRRRRDRAVHRRFAARLQLAHAIGPDWMGWLQPDTVVCRCEEVTVGALRSVAATTTSRGLRALRLNTRAGLGACQGRMCAPTVCALLDAAVPGGLLDPDPTPRRPIAAPVRLGEIARRAPPGPHPGQGSAVDGPTALPATASVLPDPREEPT